MFYTDLNSLHEAVRLSELDMTELKTAHGNTPSIRQELEKLNEVIFDLISTSNKERVCYLKNPHVKSKK